MAKPSDSQQNNWIWWSAIAVVVLLQFWWLPGERRQVRDSYSNLAHGKLGLYRVLQRLFPIVERKASALIPDVPATLIVIDSLKLPDHGDSLALAEFVRRGGSLVYAPGSEDQNWKQDVFPFDLEPLEITGNNSGDNPDNGQLHSPKESGSDANRNRTRMLPNDINVTSPLIDTPVCWRTSAQISADPRSEFSMLAGDEQQRVHAASFRLGQGMVIILSTSDGFSNQAMLDPAAAELAIRIVEYAHQFASDDRPTATPIVISETLNISRAGDTWAILLGPELRSGTLQMILIGLLIAWAGWNRFGPLAKDAGRDRKKMTESAQALGNLQFRTHHGGQVVGRYLEYVKVHLRRTLGGHAKLDNPQYLARRTGLPHDEIRREMELAREMARSGLAPPARAASSIRWLAMFQRRLTQPRSRPRRE